MFQAHFRKGEVHNKVGIKPRPRIENSAKALHAERVRIQKRRESDAKCRANLALCYHKLRERLPESGTQPIKSKKPLSKEMVLHGTIQYVHYLESAIKYLDQKQGSANQVEDLDLVQLKNDFITEYGAKYEVLQKNKKKTYKPKTRPGQMIQKHGSVYAPHLLSTKNLQMWNAGREKSENGNQALMLSGEKCVSMAIDENEYGLLVTNTGNYHLDMLEDHQTHDESEVSKYVQNVPELARQGTPDLICEEDPFSSLIIDEDSLVPNIPFKTPVKNNSPDIVKPTPLMYKKKPLLRPLACETSKFNIAADYNHQGMYYGWKRVGNNSRKRKLCLDDVEKSAWKDLTLSETAEETVEEKWSDQCSVDSDDQQRKIKRQYKKRATAARVRPWNPIKCKVESPVLPYSAFNITNKGSRKYKKTDGSPSAKRDPDFKLNEYHRKKLDSVRSLRPRPPRSSTPKINLADIDCEEIDLESSPRSGNSDWDFRRQQNKQRVSSKKKYIDEFEINGYLLFCNQVQKQLEKILPDSNLDEEPFPSTISKMWNDLTPDQQHHLIVTARTLQLVGRNFDDSLPTVIQSQESEQASFIESKFEDYHALSSASFEDGFEEAFSSLSDDTSKVESDVLWSTTSLSVLPSLPVTEMKVPQELEELHHYITSYDEDTTDDSLGDIQLPTLMTESDPDLLCTETPVSALNDEEEVTVALGQKIKTEKIDKKSIAGQNGTDAADDIKLLMGNSIISRSPEQELSCHEELDWIDQTERDACNFVDLPISTSQKPKGKPESRKLEDLLMNYVDDAIVDMVLQAEQESNKQDRSSVMSSSSDSSKNIVPRGDFGGSLDSSWDDLQVVPEWASDEDIVFHNIDMGGRCTDGKKSPVEDML